MFRFESFQVSLWQFSETIQQGGAKMLDLAVAAVVTRGLMEEQFKTDARPSPRRSSQPAPASRPSARHAEPTPRRQSWLRRLASSAS
jgi:hypothetical protein